MSKLDNLSWLQLQYVCFINSGRIGARQPSFIPFLSLFLFTFGKDSPEMNAVVNDHHDGET